jgi:hypothetical protein
MAEPPSAGTVSSSLNNRLWLGAFLLLIAILAYRKFTKSQLPEVDHPTHDAHVNASAAALDTLTTAAENHPDPPLEHIHGGAAEAKSHSWIKKYIPDAVLNDYENRYHLGNYVIDRETGEKSFEQMRCVVQGCVFKALTCTASTSDLACM